LRPAALITRRITLAQTPAALMEVGVNPTAGMTIIHPN